MAAGYIVGKDGIWRLVVSRKASYLNEKPKKVQKKTLRQITGAKVE